MISERVLTQLPVSKDLWKGFDYKPKDVEVNVPMDNAPRPFAKLDEAMAAILKASAGANLLTCTWCGLQSDTKAMRDHLKKNHPSVVEPPTEEQIFAASKLSEGKK